MTNPGENTHWTAHAALLVLAGVICAWGCADQSSTTDIAAAINTAPVIGSLTASPNAVTRGGASHISVSARDAEGDELTYSYSSTGGTFSTNGSSATWTAPYQPGKYVLTVTISDGRVSTQAWVALTVFVPLTTITGTLVLPDNSSGDLSSARVLLRAGATRATGDSLVRIVPVTGNGYQANFTIEDVQPGSYYLEAWQDSDLNGRLSVGDLYGFFGQTAHPGAGLPPLSLAEGETRFVSIPMAVVSTLAEGEESGKQSGQGGVLVKDGRPVGEGYVDW